MFIMKLNMSRHTWTMNFALKILEKFVILLLEISCSSSSIAVNKRKYAPEILEENTMFAAKPVSTHVVPNRHSFI